MIFFLYNLDKKSKKETILLQITLKNQIFFSNILVKTIFFVFMYISILIFKNMYVTIYCIIYFLYIFYDKKHNFHYEYYLGKFQKNKKM